MIIRPQTTFYGGLFFVVGGSPLVCIMQLQVGGEKSLVYSNTHLFISYLYSICVVHFIVSSSHCHS